jgi:hypothetical protein
MRAKKHYVSARWVASLPPTIRTGAFLVSAAQPKRTISDTEMGQPARDALNRPNQIKMYPNRIAGTCRHKMKYIWINLVSLHIKSNCSDLETSLKFKKNHKRNY